MGQKKPPHDASIGPLSVSRSAKVRLSAEGQNMLSAEFADCGSTGGSATARLATESQSMPPAGFTGRGNASGSVKARLVAVSQNMLPAGLTDCGSASESANARLVVEGQNMPPAGFTDCGSTDRGVNARLVVEGQNMPPAGFTERGSASTSARAPWRWARATRPGGGIFGSTTTTTTRGYQKLEGAARAFKFDFHGKIVLDIGSSTGGFTKFALDHGASRVIAIEKGTNQMEKPLRFDPRIDLREKTDIFTFRPSHPDLPDVIVADVSFLSLTKVLDYARLYLSRSDTDFLVMLKPQFEASPHQLSRGVVKNETIRRDILKRFESWLGRHGFLIIKKHDNTLAGKNGNIERFYWLRLAKNNNLRRAKRQ